MTPQQIDKILERYLKNECTEAEKLVVDEWFEAIGKDRGELHASVQQAAKERIWSKLPITEHKTNIHWKLARIAAVFVILVISTFLLLNHFPSENNGIRSAGGSPTTLRFANSGPSPKRIVMKDGSTILLQTGSEVSFADVFRDKREVFLTGEAFFEVTKNANQPFIVYANEVTTKVLGTSFLIKAYQQDEEVLVAVTTGRVSVVTDARDNKKDGPEEIIMTPNQQVVYNRSENLTTKMLVDEPRLVEEQPSIKANYKNEPVVEIFQALEKSYGIDIQYDANALSACTLTYSDITEEGLYEQIEIICNALGGRYKRNEFSIVIEAEGCKKSP
jgi:transmembrane sensor